MIGKVAGLDFTDPPDSTNSFMNESAPGTIHYHLAVRMGSVSDISVWLCDVHVYRGSHRQMGFIWYDAPDLGPNV